MFGGLLVVTNMSDKKPVSWIFLSAFYLEDI